ncbi:MAG TPA: NAD-dependent epimerase/dehydratase family protein [Burkholderiaceae bacterium]|nr:NAD-dependent epimerase/dehydratase family protein [Burkholderiaceae bacterium]
MHVVVTGATGFVGQALVARLLRQHAEGASRLDALTLLDVTFTAPAAKTTVRQIQGSIADRAVVAQAFERPVDRVFHLASIPGGTAEQQYELARDVNVLGTLHLLEAAKAQTEQGRGICRFVFASTVAVYGSPLPPVVDDDTALNPQMTYGAQKLMGEIAVADFSRRAWLDGCSLRLPGVLARPPARTGQLSAFMSNIIRELAAGRAFTCPTTPAATTWASSIHSVVDNLLHAASMDTSGWPPRRSLALPTLRFTMEELVAAIAAVHGPQVRQLVRWAPDECIEALFGRFPPLRTPTAEALGFRHDGDLPTLVRRAIEPF